ncbi:MAG TPA: electron transfer flavoprotein-ubiquinone oxidoreductase [Pyrinomonadaceae bacterium]|nr:electron transfer flavoprotein-ubiquinone oxidoreductase [Pyrinomonadaceae bacterium]
MTERDRIEVDVLFVGAGPANLAAAYHLKRKCAEYDHLVDLGVKKTSKIGEIEIAILEKGSAVGSHILSGAIMDPKAIRELMPDFLEQGCPVDSVVTEDGFWYLTQNRALEFPIVPPPLRNKGKYIVSLSNVCHWLGEKCEELGINIFIETPATELIFDKSDRAIGVRTGDKGIDKKGIKKANYEPGAEVFAKVIVLGEGSRGSLAKQAFARLGLMEGKEEQVYSLGVKELWEIPEENFPVGKAVHTLGFPSDANTYGGGWIYGAKKGLVSIGYVTGLDYEDPRIDPHAEFQRFKTHPKIAEILRGGKMIKYGAKSINTGGFWTMPKLFADGLMLVGDSASVLNGQRIKGIHTAMKSGMLAAETIIDALVAGDTSAKQLRHYEERVNLSWIYDELYPVRNFHAAFQMGRFAALINTGLQYLTRGLAWGFMPRQYHKPGYERIKKLADLSRDGIKTENKYSDLKFDKELTFDKVTDVFHATVVHSEDQPPHLHVLDPEICAGKCAEEYSNPCEKFCPAAVYEMQLNNETGRKELKINFTNCVHCKTCDIADPYQIINWVTPEGGGGPNYKGM